MEADSLKIFKETCEGIFFKYSVENHCHDAMKGYVRESTLKFIVKINNTQLKRIKGELK